MAFGWSQGWQATPLKAPLLLLSAAALCSPSGSRDLLLLDVAHFYKLELVVVSLPATHFLHVKARDALMEASACLWLRLCHQEEAEIATIIEEPEAPRPAKERNVKLALPESQGSKGKMTPAKAHNKDV